MNKQLAKITSARLEIQDRDIFMFWIYVEYEEGGGQGVGGFCLDTWDLNRERRIGTAYGCEMIMQILRVLKVNDFSEMKGQNIWVLGEAEGFNFTPKGIQPLRITGGDAEPLIFDAVYEEFNDV